MNGRVQYRATTTAGKGIGRWRFYFEAEDAREVRFAISHLVASAQVRVVEKGAVVFGPMRADEALRALDSDLARYGHVAAWR